jgi:heme-degrading monooxygenase HmoA
MYISRTEARVPAEQQDALKQRLTERSETLRALPGFRWAMLLREIGNNAGLVAISMWQTPAQAAARQGNVLADDETRRGYDVTTARGSMTPATNVVIVDWQVDDDVAARFTNRWNAFYHAIEDRIGSRLMKDLERPGNQTGVHVMTDASHLNPEMFGTELNDPDGLSMRPAAVRCYDVVLLAEA